MLYGFNYFKFVEACFMVQDMVILVSVSCALEKHVASAIVGSSVL